MVKTRFTVAIAFATLCSAAWISVAGCGGSGSGGRPLVPTTAEIVASVATANTPAEARTVVQQTIGRTGLGVPGTAYEYFDASAMTLDTWQNSVLFDQEFGLTDVTLGLLFSNLRTSLNLPGLPTDSEAIDRLRTRANSAWSDPNEAENAVIVLGLNSTPTLSPTPPAIGPSTQVTLYRAYLLVYWYLAAHVLDTARGPKEECRLRAFIKKNKKEWDIKDAWMTDACSIWRDSGTFGPVETVYPTSFWDELDRREGSTAAVRWAQDQGMTPDDQRKIEDLWDKSRRQMIEAEEEYKADLEKCHAQ